MDGIIDTVAGPHSLNPLVDLMKTGGKLVLVGASVKNPELPTMPLMLGNLITSLSLHFICYFKI